MTELNRIIFWHADKQSREFNITKERLRHWLRVKHYCLSIGEKK